MSDDALATACDAAAEHYRGSIGSSAGPGEVSAATARVLELAGHAEEALAGCRRALEEASFPLWPSLLNQLTRCSRAAGAQLETARWLAEHARATETPALLLWSGELRRDGYDLAGAEAELAECARLVQDGAVAFPAAHMRMECLVALGRMDAAISACHEAIPRFPEHELPLRSNLAGFLTGAGRFAEALAEADAVLAADAEVATAHFIRGAALLRMGRRPEALPALAEAERLSPTLGPQARALLEGAP